MLGGVTFIHGELTKTNSATTQGNTPIGVPSVQVNVGAEWDTPFLPGLTLAGNVIHTDEQFVNTANTQKIPSWTRLDLGARYTPKSTKSLLPSAPKSRMSSTSIIGPASRASARSRREHR
ncbi:hypothetical protein AJ87_37945 [Rhizobium yanglingense]|nr:hypothetical protein AJ87_37945 [Rhizobium yanglingense]